MARVLIDEMTKDKKVIEPDSLIQSEHMLEEYKETVAFMRHDDQMAWTILGLSFTLAFGVWAYTFKDVPFWSRRAILLSLFGVIVFIFGRLLARRISAHTESRRKRAVELEKKLGFELMGRLGDRMVSKGLGINRMLDGITVLTGLCWIIYFCGYLFLSS